MSRVSVHRQRSGCFFYPSMLNSGFEALYNGFYILWNINEVKNVARNRKSYA